MIFIILKFLKYDIIITMNIDLIKKYIFSQKIKVIEELDFEKGKIKYSDSIKQYREIKNFKGNEEIVRAYLLSKLTNELGYKLENIEIEKEYDIGRPKTNKPRIDVIVRDDKGNAFLYIEVKSPDEFEKNKDEVIEKQLFNLASQEKGEGKEIKYLVLYSFEMIEDKIRDRAIIIDYQKYSSFSDWEKERNFTDKLPKRYGKAQKEPFIKGGKKDLRFNFNLKELEEKRKNLHNVLWGGGGTDDNDIFASLVNIILAKIQDESEREIEKEYQFQIFSFKNGDRFESNQEIFERINNLYKRALRQRMYITDEEKIKKSYVIDENKFSLSKLRYTIQELEEYSFVEGKSNLNGKDILGQFFEGIIRKGFKQTKGQFFTHSNIIKFILYALKLDKLAIERINKDKKIPYLIDPSAGSGTFLIEYMNFITKNIKYKQKDKLNKSIDIRDKFNKWFMPDNKENRWAKDFIYGIEHNFNLGTASKVNMILHGDGSTNIFIRDGLLPFNFYTKEESFNLLNKSEQDKKYFDKEINGRFDVVISNPPFSVDLDKDTKKTLNRNFIFKDKKNSENLFVERWYQLLKENGRLGVVLPESVFDTAENKYIRLFIYKYFKIKAVISLPQLTFQPYTSTKTSLLFAQKKTKKEIEKWNELWNKYSNEYNLLKTRAEKEIEYFIEKKEMNKKWAISKETEKKRKENILRLLDKVIEEKDKNLTLKELVEKYQNQIKDLLKTEKDNVFGFVNTWWVFSNVSKELNYPIFMAEVENIGYKRTKRGLKSMPNELFRIDKNEEVIIDDNIKKTALDFIRSGVEWE
jgi:type I restriction enzyme M protein